MPDEKKVALITGANKGIGREVARKLAAVGLIVLIGARERARGEETAAAIQSEGGDAHFIQLDVTSQADIDAAAAEIDKTYGRLDVLVNNAGIAISEGR